MALRATTILTMCWLAAAGAAPAPAPRPAAVKAALEAAQQRLYAHLDDAKRILGYDTTNDVILRINDDLAAQDESRPSDFPEDVWNESVVTIQTLDTSLVDQALNAKPRRFDEIAGLGETLVHVRKDDTYQPVAVYVPSAYQAGVPAPLIVALHGRPQTETELLGPPWLRSLAESSGAIAIAPWGRGLYDFAQPAADEVYETIDAAEAELSIDPKKVYLVGYSMGGFSVFKVAPLHGERWAGVMSIAGAVLNSEMASVTANLRRVPIYVVNGSNDEEIPPKYGDDTAQVLAKAGLLASFYQQPRGTHALRTLEPALSNAWNDMLHAVVNVQRPAEGQNGVTPAALPRHPS